MMIENKIYNQKSIIISTIYGSLPIVAILIYTLANNHFLDSKSLLLGLITSIFNFYVILWAWSRIFIKKRIALATSVIVIKYALLGLIIYKIVFIETYEIASFLIGMVSIIFMIIIYAVIQNMNNNRGIK